MIVNEIHKHIPKSSFSKFASSNLIGNVCSTQNGTVHIQLIINHAGNQTQLAILIMRNSLNTRNGIGSGKNVMLDLFQGSGKELMRNAKHKAVCILHHLNEIRNSNDILGKLVTRKIRKVKE